MHPQSLSIQDFTYLLPEDRIAKYPLPERDASKILIYQRGNITEDIYRNLEQHLPANTLLIFNDTKVVEARILFQKPTGGIIEIFCLEPHEVYVDIAMGMLQKGRVLWQCMIGGASKWKHGQLLEKKIKTPEKEILLVARYVEKKHDSFTIEFSWNDASMSFAEILHHTGAIPLPPYLKREAENSDNERYQTIYAHQEGSVAAPTAGLHFTKDLMTKLKAKNIQTEFVTLHVGAGTFKPVKSKTLEEHEMHAEYIKISKRTIRNILKNLSENIIAVGTTSLRVIESLYWLGVKLRSGEKNDLMIRQWEPYDRANHDLSAGEAVNILLEFMDKQDIEDLHLKTRILIAPSYEIKITNALITNFHQPQSTLLLLVAAFVGTDWKRIYDYALKNNFRFLSYGDGCLLWSNYAGTGEMTG
jgi:S-adenosylmethionine:tRNA ribosyltransferase-isomerase